MASKALISIKNMGFTYENYAMGKTVNKVALTDINLDIYEGEILLIMGPSGCGKTTLLRSLKKEAVPYGISTGKVESATDSSKISIVFSNPETQLVTTTVLSDLALTMENLGYDAYTQKKRMSETVSYFGIEDILHRHPDTLSGGQKQIVSLCSQLMVHPEILLLDEPISQLDPISALEFTDILRRLNEEIGITIVMTEHRPDDVISLANRVVYMEDSRILFQGQSREVLKKLWETGKERVRDFLPVVSKCSLLIDKERPACITSKELNFMVRDYLPIKKAQKENDDISFKMSEEKTVRIRELFFAYTKEKYAIRNLDLDVCKGEFLCIMGSNGSGKTTLLKIMSGILKPHIGRIKASFGKIQYMPQELNLFFTEDTVYEQMSFKEMDKDLYLSLVEELNLKDILYKHPYDLSSGEQQKAVLACMLLRKPDFILLDEPTKSMDPSLKRVISRLLKQSGATIVCATHDLEFAAKYADRCVMMFNGEIAYSMDARNFFKENRYYTTSVNRAFGRIDTDMVLYEDVENAFGGTV
ncbi:MAG TPA: ATP-binding cassette domain-containing protein [Clostridia bacterium]|jgi:energy-coupling factor transport system ATP-binding protein|nr:ATP-binding cassette domain-containing protein [Clostridia bacterium]HPY98452.1 ATP-binding cassette domain-containing protein [Clostridia bacterium]HQC68330.1 ATP-binding cassette domain-containing protein [Clostridia bacterium]